jgi:hypothetical protein
VLPLFCLPRVAERVFDYSSHYDHLMEAAQDMGQVRAAGSRLLYTAKEALTALASHADQHVST